MCQKDAHVVLLQAQRQVTCGSSSRPGLKFHSGTTVAQVHVGTCGRHVDPVNAEERSGSHTLDLSSLGTPKRSAGAELSDGTHDRAIRAWHVCLHFAAY